MPPLPGQKGTGKKGGARRSRSRNTTPSSVGGPPTTSNAVDETAFTELKIVPYQRATYDEIVEQHNGSAIPDSRSLDSLLDRLKRLLEAVDARHKIVYRGMSEMSHLRQERSIEIEAERRDDEHRERMRRDEEEGLARKAAKSKKKKDLKARDERPLSHGSHGLAPQDGTAHGNDVTSSPRPKAQGKAVRDSHDADSASSSLSPVEPTTPAAQGNLEPPARVEDEDDDDDDSSDDHQPPKAPAVPHLQTFGDDPSTFPDPTVYEIRKVTPDMGEAEKKEIYSVAQYPHNDLKDLIPGTPPDKDFSNAKPTNQVQANTFAAYLEPYFRPYTEEDLAFLREKGDRTNAFVIPRKGKKGYREVWAEEDGAMSIDGPSQDRGILPPNQARGNLEDMDEAMAETDQVSAGPVLSRLLAVLRPETRAPLNDSNGTTNGESSNAGENADLNDILGLSEPPPLQPATFMTESATDSWKKATHPKLDHGQVDERIKQELRHIGFLPPDSEPDYDAAYDDDVAARLRYLQGQLKDVAIQNAAKKARLMDLVKERLAYQEFSTICEDLDSQVNAAYTKRTRTMGKSKKTKRPGGAGGGSHFAGGQGQAKPGIGDLTKTLMERRKKWMTDIGPVFDSERSLTQVPRSRDEGSSIFKPEDMAEYIKREREAWDEEVEEE